MNAQTASEIPKLRELLGRQRRDELIDLLWGVILARVFYDLHVWYFTLHEDPKTYFSNSRRKRKPVNSIIVKKRHNSGKEALINAH